VSVLVRSHPRENRGLPCSTSPPRQQGFFGVEAFEEQLEVAMGFRPRNAHGPNAVIGTVHSRNAGNQDRLELAGNQVSPLAFLPMLVTREMLLAFRRNTRTGTAMPFVSNSTEWESQAQNCHCDIKRIAALKRFPATAAAPRKVPSQ
jgi:hypothetical protein